MTAELGSNLVVLDAVTDYNLSRTEEQLELLEIQIREYKPNLVIIEADAQQKALGNDDRMRALADTYGFTIKPHLTRGQKVDEIFGVAAMDQSFKKGEIRIPYGDQHTQDRMSAFIAQLRSWRPDIKTMNLTQDLVMALWFVWRVWHKMKLAIVPPPVTPAWRPSWTFNENLYRGKALTG